LDKGIRDKFGVRGKEIGDRRSGIGDRRI